MRLNKEELINKILYRSSYRGTKEMDLLMKSFVKSIIYDLDVDGLLKLNELVNLDDEILYKIRTENFNKNNFNENYIVNKFKKYKL